MDGSMEEKRLAECEKLTALVRQCSDAATLCGRVQEVWLDGDERSDSGLLQITIAATPYWAETSGEFRSVRFIAQGGAYKGAFTMGIPEFNFGEGQNNGVAIRTLVALLEGFFESLSNEAKAGVIERMQPKLQGGA